MSVIWEIKDLVRQDIGDKKDVITYVKWSARKEDGEYNGYTSGYTMLVDDEEDIGSSFTEFEKLTKDNVIDLLKAKLGNTEVTAYEKQVTDQIEREKSTPTIKNGVPTSW